MYTEQLSQALAFNGNPVHPASIAVGTSDTGGVDLQLYKRALAIVDVGSVGAAGTVDMKWQESTDNVTFTDLAGTNVAITQITANNKIATLEVRSDQITKRYVRARVTVGANAVTLCQIILGGVAIHKPGGAGAGVGGDVAAVAQRQVVS